MRRPLAIQGLLRLPRFPRFGSRRKKTDPLVELEQIGERLWVLAMLLGFLLAASLFLPRTIFGEGATIALLTAMAVLLYGYFRERLKTWRTSSLKVMEGLRAENIKLERSNQQLNSWGESSRRLIASFDQQRLLDLIVSTAIDMTRAEKGSIMLLDDERKELRIAAAVGLSDTIKATTRTPIGDGIAGWVALKGEPVLLTRSSPDFRLQRRLIRQEISSAISVPIRIDAMVVGTLNVNESTRGEEFTQEDLRVLTMFAAQAGLALEQAHMYHESQVQLERMLALLDELQTTQQQLVHTEKLASVGTLAGGVAHEINNPLMVIMGRTELLMMKPRLPKAIRNDLEIIHNETGRITEIVRGLLNFSHRSQDDTFDQVNVNDILERTIALTQHQLRGDNVSIHAMLYPDLPKVSANSGQLQQVFTNMIINANHAMAPNGGMLAIRTQRTANGVSIEFEDTGCGIPQEALKKIFDPFFTTKPEGQGTGLGLAISHSIIDRHNGEITVFSEPGRGTTFLIRLPGADTPQAPKQDPSARRLTEPLPFFSAKNR